MFHLIILIGRRGGAVSDRLLHTVRGLCGHQAGGLLGHTRGEVARVQGASEGPLPFHSREGCGTLGQVGASEGLLPFHSREGWGTLGQVGVDHTGASEGPLVQCTDEPSLF